MREILFRGKRVDNGEWEQGYYFRVWDEHYICWGTENGNPMKKQVIPETVGQDTGLTDKNGKKIFEGDICEFDNGEPDENERYTNYAVQWDCVNCRYVVVDGRNCEDCLDIFFAKHAEVIGNIHDNPELLEVGE